MNRSQVIGAALFAALVLLLAVLLVRTNHEPTVYPAGDTSQLLPVPTP